MILVLGMLALMLIMATAFSVMMRTEHAGAGNFSDEIRSKHVVWAALADAVANIEANIPDTDLYPAWEGLGPQGTDLSQNTGTVQVNVVWGKAGDFVPGRLYDLAADAYSDWVVDHTSGVRYSYLVLNCSGLLDGNYAGGSNRMAGVHPNELYIANLPDVVNTDDLAQRRDDDVRYETLQEFNLYQGEDSGMAGGIAGSYSDTFVVGSYCPDGWWSGSPGDSVETNRMYIGDDPEEWTPAEKSMFETKLNAACGPPLDADFIYEQLLDYLDEDSTPRSLDSPSMEAVPMFNEVLIMGAAAPDPTPGMMRLALGVNIEWFYPFVRANDKSFEIDRQITVKIEAGGAEIYTEKPVSGWNWGEEPLINSTYNPAVVLGNNIVNVPVGPSPEHLVIFEGANGAVVNVTVSVRLKMLEVDALTGATVDAVPSPDSDPALVFKFDPLTLPGTLNPKGFVAVDPRFNWRTHGNPPCWFPAADPTLGDMNDMTLTFLAGGAAGIDTNASMYVSDAGRLFSEGELGNLLRTDAPGIGFFKTIRIFDLPNADMDEIFRHFTVKAGSSSRGLVNLNTDCGDVLCTAFTNMPMAYPSNTIKIAVDDITRITNAIGMNQEFVNVSELGHIDWRSVLPSWTGVERDAMLAYTSGLLGTRQNLFTIIIMGGPAEQGMGQTGRQKHGWFGLRRAVAVVWRDPFPIEGTGSGPDNPLRHRYVLRSFNWLDE